MQLTLAEIISLCGYGILALFAFFSQLAKRFKKVRPLEVVSSIEKILNDFIPQAIIEAESSGMNGSAKKLFVLSRIVIECASKGVNYQENAKLFEETIEKLVELSKVVNTYKKDESINVVNHF